MDKVKSNNIHTSFIKVNGVLVPLEHYEDEKIPPCKVLTYAVIAGIAVILFMFVACWMR